MKEQVDAQDARSMQKKMANNNAADHTITASHGGSGTGDGAGKKRRRRNRTKGNKTKENGNEKNASEEHHLVFGSFVENEKGGQGTSVSWDQPFKNGNLELPSHIMAVSLQNGNVEMRNSQKINANDDNSRMMRMKRDERKEATRDGAIQSRKHQTKKEQKGMEKKELNTADQKTVATTTTTPQPQMQQEEVEPVIPTPSPRKVLTSWASLFKSQPKQESPALDQTQKGISVPSEAESGTKGNSVGKERKTEKRSKGRKKMSPTKTSEQYESEGDSILSNSHVDYDPNTKVFVQPRGLTNVKNSCFMNAILQAFLFDPHFHNMFQQLEKMNLDKDTYPLTKKIIRFIKEFKPMNESNTRIESGAPFTPQYILDYMKTVDQSLFIMGNQHDAHEFLTFLLDRLHEELSITAEARDNAAPSSNVDDGWEEVGARNRKSRKQEIQFDKSVISRAFSGNLRSLLKKQRGKGSLTVQPFYSLHLPIHREVETVEDALKAMVTVETLESNVQKQISIEQLPQVLILQLKRFTYDEKSTSIKKIQRRIAYDENLHLDTSIVPVLRLPAEDSARNYILSSVVCHHGRDASGGHYSTYARHGCGKWMHMNDERCTIVSLDHVMEQQAYILIYQQLHPQASTKTAAY